MEVGKVSSRFICGSHESELNMPTSGTCRPSLDRRLGLASG
jgi:hypothetical protein